MSDDRPSAVDAVTASFAAIDRRESEVRAFVHLDREIPFSAAKAIDQTDGHLPLRGMTIGVKDIFDTYDYPTEFGSPIHRGRRTDRDASCVALLRGAGAVVIGKTVTAEFASPSPGPTTNPHDITRTPGGSSSGSAAAVASGMVRVALGTQTAGSVIRPASFCGVLGFKPTFGTISRRGVLEVGQTLDTVGVFSLDAGDAAVAVAVMAERPDFLESLDDQAMRTVGVLHPTGWEDAEAATRDAIENAVDALRASGVHVEELETPPWYADAVADQRVVQCIETHRAFADERLHHEADLSPAFEALLVEAESYDIERQSLAARRRVAAFTDATVRFAPYDVLLTPAANGEAPIGLGHTGDPAFAAPWSLLGVPTASVPFSTGPHAMPVGVQVVGGWRQDHVVLSAAQQLLTLA